MKFLGGLVKTLVGGVGNKLVSKLFDPSPSEANQQSISNHNNFLSGTIGTRIAADKQYADAMYPGTSPWERLGSSPAAPLQSQDGGTSREAMAMPMKTALLQAASQQEIAKQNNETTKDVAEINAATERYKSDQSTAHGALPGNQALVAKAQAFLAEEQTVTEGAKQHLMGTQAAQIHNETLLSRARALIEMLPKEGIDLGAYKLESRVGWQKVAQWLQSKEGSKESSVSFDNVVNSLGDAESAKLLRDVAKIAGSITSAGRAAGSWLSTLKGGASLFRK